MRISIKVRDFELSDALREHVEHRLAFALSQFQDRVPGVVVVLSIDGPMGGIDKRCRLQIHLTRRFDLIIEETEADFQVAVRRAADRARGTLTHVLLRAQPSRQNQAL